MAPSHPGMTDRWEYPHRVSTINHKVWPFQIVGRTISRTIHFPKSEIFGLENHLGGGFPQESKLAVVFGPKLYATHEMGMRSGFQ